MSLTLTPQQASSDLTLTLDEVATRLDVPAADLRQWRDSPLGAAFPGLDMGDGTALYDEGDEAAIKRIADLKQQNQSTMDIMMTLQREGRLPASAVSAADGEVPAGQSERFTNPAGEKGLDAVEEAVEATGSMPSSAAPPSEVPEAVPGSTFQERLVAAHQARMRERTMGQTLEGQLQQALADINEENTRLQQVLSERHSQHEAALASLEAQLETLRDQGERDRREADGAQARLSSLEESLAEARQEAEALRAQLSENDQAKEAILANQARLVETNSQLRSGLEAVLGEIASLRAVLAS
ncbi:hypothetical protein E3E12_00835 [Formicincola oecophyllae]|uniref:HTH merR-type domain-containing protein n=1 Tax=Formicincola oecophyllae TaxID=2558361 RepID=A0A4Y6U6K3_9PROT|nr:MerR family transcriptional regulator [Formicincola oecophyllae]QDH12983.1 hypothetical protein E3E12_00835 [Formicincola oecophyllae]